MKTFDFPVLMLDGQSIDKLNYRKFVCDKRFIKQAFKDVTIVDSKGTFFDLEGVEQAGGLDIFYSLKFMGYMVAIKPILKKPPYSLEFSELIERIKSIISRNPGFFRSLSAPQDLIDDVQNCTKVSDLFKIF